MSAIVFRSGALSLEGELTLPPQPAGAAVLCHPHPLYGGDMHNNVVRALESGFARARFATLRFNFRGVGRSEGGYGNGVGEAEDVVAAAAELLARSGEKQVTLAGYSFGAMMVVHAASRIAAADRLVAVAVPLSFGGLDALADDTRPKLFLAGDRDSYCPADQLERSVAALPDPKGVVILPGADHFLGGYEEEIAAAVASAPRS